MNRSNSQLTEEERRLCDFIDSKIKRQSERGSKAAPSVAWICPTCGAEECPYGLAVKRAMDAMEVPWTNSA